MIEFYPNRKKNVEIVSKMCRADSHLADLARQIVDGTATPTCSLPVQRAQWCILIHSVGDFIFTYQA